MFSFILSGAWLLLAGPLGLLRAGGAGLAHSIVVTALFILGGLQFEAIGQYLALPVVPVALFVLATVPLPFWVSGLGRTRNDWGYAALFSDSWDGVVRGFAALLFVGIAWGLVFVSSTVLQMVGIDWIARAIEIEWMPFTITGGALGLALAVSYELRTTLSPAIIQRLLCLLVPVVFAVAALFLAGLAIRGVGFLPELFSTAGTLMGFAAVIATVVTAAVDLSDDEAVQGRIMVTCTRLLAGIVLVFALIAAWSLWLRVAAYGWTPERVNAAAFAFIALGYGVFYAVSVVMRAWRTRMRQSNILQAVVLVLKMAAMLSSLVSSERISAKSQFS